MAAAVSRAICVQKPGSKCSRDREATSFARRTVAAPRPPRAKAAGVIRSDSGAGRGQQCSPLRAVVDAASIQTTKKVSLAALRNRIREAASNSREHFWLAGYMYVAVTAEMKINGQETHK
jgi:hypothetical protein